MVFCILVRRMPAKHRTRYPINNLTNAMHRITLSFTTPQYQALESLMATDLAKPTQKSAYIAHLIAEEVKKRATMFTVSQ